MTCREMGGPCETVIMGNTPKEMMDNGMKHAAEMHPDMAEQMKKMPKADMDKWTSDFYKKWNAAPDMM